MSSFCFTRQRCPDEDEDEDWYYYGLPPVNFRSLGASFRPDYSIFFLCDKFFVDALTIERVDATAEFGEHGELFKALRDTGRLEVVDYRATIRPYDDLIFRSAAQDMADLSSWITPFLDLRTRWRQFIQFSNSFDRCLTKRPMYLDGSTRSEVLTLARDYNPMVPGILDEWLEHCLTNWKHSLTRHERERTRSVVWPYLAHVAATMCLADCLGATIHDWADIAPLYRHKLSNAVAVQRLQHQNAEETCREILTLMFPDFRPKSALALARLLDDPRTDTLRQLVERCVKTNMTIDAGFANALLRELLAQEEKLNRYRNISGWLTVPLSFVPWVGTALEKATQIAIERRLANNVRGDNEWFFLLSAVNEVPQTGTSA